MSTVPSLLVPGQVARNVKNYIVSKAYSRNRGPIALFNDFDFRTGRTCAAAARKARNKRDEASSLDACLQSYPPTVSAYQAETSQLSVAKKSSIAGFYVPGGLPDVTSTLAASAVTNASTLAWSGTSAESSKVSRSSNVANLYTYSNMTASPDPVTISGSSAPRLGNTSVQALRTPAAITEITVETVYPSPHPREVVTSVVWVTPPSPSSTTGAFQPVATFAVPTCNGRYSSTVELDCDENCWGGECIVQVYRFWNPSPRWACRRCPSS